MSNIPLLATRFPCVPRRLTNSERRGDFAEAAQAYKKMLKEELEDYITENEDTKKLVETASRAMGNTRLLAVAEEATPLEVGGMTYLKPGRQKRVEELRRLLW